MDRKTYWKFMLLLPFIGMVYPPILVGMLMAITGYIIFALISIHTLNKLNENNTKIYLACSPIIAGVFQIFSLANPLIWLGQPNYNFSSIVEHLGFLALATTGFGYMFLFIAAVFYWLLCVAGKFKEQWV